jgi:hypothetical protein
MVSHQTRIDLARRGLGFQMNLAQIKDIPDDEWDQAAEIVIAEIRAETGIPNWLPTYLNGSDEFEIRTLKLISKRRKLARLRS